MWQAILRDVLEITLIAFGAYLIGYARGHEAGEKYRDQQFLN